MDITSFVGQQNFVTFPFPILYVPCKSEITFSVSHFKELAEEYYGYKVNKLCDYPCFSPLSRQAFNVDPEGWKIALSKVWRTLNKDKTHYEFESFLGLPIIIHMLLINVLKLEHEVKLVRDQKLLTINLTLETGTHVITEERICKVDPDMDIVPLGSKYGLDRQSHVKDLSKHLYEVSAFSTRCTQKTI